MWCEALLLAVLALSFHTGDALKCHQCTSVSDPKCGDPIDSSVGLTECTPDFMKDASKMLPPEANSGWVSIIGLDLNPQFADTNGFACVKAVKPDGNIVKTCSIPGDRRFDICAKLYDTPCETCNSDGCNAIIIKSGVATVCPAALLVVAATVLLARL